MSVDKAGVQSWMFVACSEVLGGKKDLTTSGWNASRVVLNLSPAESPAAQRHLDFKIRVNRRRTCSLATFL